MAHEELILQIQQIEQQASQIDQYLQTLDQQIIGMQQLQLGLGDVEKGKGKESLSAVGAGFYVKTTLQSDKVLVHVGGQIFVEKTFSEAKEFLEQKISELNLLKNKLIEELGQLQIAMQDLAIEIQQKNNHSHEHDHSHLDSDFDDDEDD